MDAPEQWSTDEEVQAAKARYRASIPGYEPPVAYGVARVDDELVWGHINEVGGTHMLPAVILASVCGHAAGNATYELSATQFDDAIVRLTPAEACTDYDHPNLWSWRVLAASGGATSSYVAVFVNDLSLPPANDHERQFRAQLNRISPPS